MSEIQSGHPCVADGQHDWPPVAGLPVGRMDNCGRCGGERVITSAGPIYRQRAPEATPKSTMRLGQARQRYQALRKAADAVAELGDRPDVATGLFREIGDLLASEYPWAVQCVMCRRHFNAYFRADTTYAVQENGLCGECNAATDGPATPIVIVLG